MNNYKRYSLIEVLTSDLEPNTLFSAITFFFFIILFVFLIMNHGEKEEAKETEKEIKKIKKEITKICWPQWSQSENYITDIDQFKK